MFSRINALSDRVRNLDDRYRRIAFSALIGIIGRGLTSLVPLISVPLTLGYLGDAKFGTWATATAFVSALRFADLGLGLGLINLTSDCEARGDRDRMTGLVSTTFFALVALSLALGVVFMTIVGFVHWGAILGMPNAPRGAFRSEVTVLVLFFLVGIPLSVVDKVFLALQKVHINSIVQVASAAVLLIMTVLAVKLNFGLIGLMAATASAPVLTQAAAAVYLFVKERPYLLPRLSRVSKSYAKEVFSSGVRFLVLNVCATISYTSDVFVVSAVMGSAAVAVYSVHSRLFVLVGTLSGIFFTPLWPEIAAAANSDNVRWIERTLRRSVTLVVAASGAIATLLLVASPYLIRKWTANHPVQPEPKLLIVLAVWSVLGCLSNLLATVMNALDIIAVQIKLVVAASVTNLFLSVLMTRHYGSIGVVLGSVVASLLIVPYILKVVVPQRLRQIEIRGSAA